MEGNVPQMYIMKYCVYIVCTHVAIIYIVRGVRKKTPVYNNTIGGDEKQTHHTSPVRRRREDVYHFRGWREGCADVRHAGKSTKNRRLQLLVGRRHRCKQHTFIQIVL